MLMKSRLTEKDFINASFVLLYSKPAIKIITGMFIVFLIVSIITPDISYRKIHLAGYPFFRFVLLIVIPLTNLYML